MNSNYRFKTREEMVATLGEQWENKLGVGWGGSRMDKYLGTVYPDSPSTLPPNMYSQKSYGYISEGGSLEIRWTITPNMLRLVDEVAYQAFLNSKPKYSVRLKEVSGQDLMTVYVDDNPVATVHYDITSNCQLGSIGSFESLFHVTNTMEELPGLVDEIFNRLGDMDNCKNMYLIDVHQTYKPNIECLKNRIVTLSDYNSTNGSKMMIGIIRSNNYDY